ncbi:pentapeptide repeat-containing protein [Campylobacter lari]|nr:pentapeptide repeat-containing protein [Campylobacter lari]
MRLHMEKDEKRRKEIEDILEKDDEELAKLYMKKYYKTIREKREEIANALKIKVDDVVYDKSEKFISGNRNKFEIYHKTIKHFDIYSLNEYEIDFYHCNIEFILSKGPSVYAENINFKKLYFINCKISINIVDDFCCENIHFLNCDIYSLSFNKVIVKGNIKFSNSKFVNKSVFNSCIFQDSIYFNNSHFKDYVDLHACKFENSVCFYGVTFEKTPNFSACYFKEQKAVNLTNVNIDNLDFESVEKYIEDNYQDETYKNEIENIHSEEKEKINLINNKHQLRCTKNLKDSFRVIKDVLISQNNILEAQEWHKLELYAKEKELEINLEKYEKIMFSPRKIKYKYLNKKNITCVNFINGMEWCVKNFFDSLFTPIEYFINIFGAILYYFIMGVIHFFPLILKLVKILFLIICFYGKFENKYNFRIFSNKQVSNIIVKDIKRKLYDYTIWTNCVLLIVYRATSDHHTNFLKIFNFTIGMITLYCSFVFVANKLPLVFSLVEKYNNYFIIVPLVIMFFLLIVNFYIKKIKQRRFIGLFFMFVGISIMFVLFFPGYFFNAIELVLYVVLLWIFTILFNSSREIIIFSLRLYIYLGLIYCLVMASQFINPFIGVFSSEKLHESKIEKAIQDLNSSSILNLAKISHKDFNLSWHYQDISFVELDAAKKLIMENKENILDLKEQNLTIATEFLGKKYTEISKAINQDEIASNVIKSTSVLYSIILLLCIFSLQKTARKNSIVPS